MRQVLSNLFQVKAKRVSSLGAMVLMLGVQLFIVSCQSDDPVARPYAYARAILPQVQPAQYQGKCLPLTFEYNAVGLPVCVEPTASASKPVSSSANDAQWMNLTYPALGAQWHLSYHPIEGVRYEDGRQVERRDALAVLMAETQRMTFKHTLKATAIEEEIISYPEHQVYGTLYVVGGDAASQTQFYVTDSIRHYLRGSLYFGVSPNSDSLEPYSAYLLKDMRRILATLRW
jgi:gliding motility-associated lipoprotein GldD